MTKLICPKGSQYKEKLSDQIALVRVKLEDDAKEKRARMIAPDLYVIQTAMKRRSRFLPHEIFKYLPERNKIDLFSRERNPYGGRFSLYSYKEIRFLGGNSFFPSRKGKEHEYCVLDKALSDFRPYRGDLSVSPIKQKKRK